MGPSEPWLSLVFLGELDDAARSRFEQLPAVALEAMLAAALTAGRDTWPELDLDPAQFARHLAGIVEDQVATIDPTHAADLYLACAAATGDARAVGIIEREYVARIDAALRTTGLDAAGTDDVKQRVREFLFVAPDGAPGIANYRARGPLRGWIRAVAVRQAMMHFRGRREVAGDDALEEMPDIANNPELAPWKDRYASSFRAAFAEAIEALDDGERTLLRQHHLDRLSIDALAALHRVHRATAARWVAAARVKLLAGVRARMTSQLGISGPELDSALRMARSRLDVSIHRLFVAKRPG